MILIRFLWLLLRRGSWSHSPYDFAAERERTLASLHLSGLSSKKREISHTGKAAYTLRANLSFFVHARNMNRQFFVSEEKGLVYVRILKAASTSFLKEFLPFIDPRLKGKEMTDIQVDALAFHNARKKLTAGEEKFPKFALIRNPFHRLVSVYLDLFDPAAAHFSYDALWFGILRKDMNFAEFVETIFHIPEYWRGPHFSSQHYILSQAGGLEQIQWFSIDKNLEKLHSFLNQYGIKLGQHNQHNTRYNYRSFYNKETLSKAHSLYQKDVEYFGYEEEFNSLRDSL